MKIKTIKKLKLYGFNNLTKSLSFNMYDICYAQTLRDRQGYIEYIDEQYNADRLTGILANVAKIIGAKILNIAKQDYDPQGASVTILVSEVNEVTQQSGSINIGPLSETVIGHLDKSHITVHTYPESSPDDGISTFRADIDVSTCGKISPLKALNYLIHSFESDIITIDYRVRGFTRDINGKKYFMDHKINSVQDYIPANTLEKYQIIDVNVYQENIFHTKMLLREFDLNNYLFGISPDDLTPEERRLIIKRLKKEMLEIFSGRNLTRL